MFTLLFTFRKSKLKRKLLGRIFLRISLRVFLRLFDIHFADPLDRYVSMNILSLKPDVLVLEYRLYLKG